MQPRGRGRARGGRARGESSHQEANRPGPPSGSSGGQRGPPGPPGSSRGGGFPQGGGAPAPQGAWGRPHPQSSQPPQGAWGRPQEQRPPQQASQPQGAWARQPQQGQSQPPQFQQHQQGGRGNRGAGEETSSSRSGHDEQRVVTGSGDAGAAQHASDAEKRGGNGGVRGRMNRYEIIHTKPSHLQSKKGSSGQEIMLTANYFKVINTPNWCLHQYRVDFNPEIDDTRKKRKLVQIAYKHENDIGGFLFDGTLMFTALRLQPDPLERVAKLDDTNVCITVKWVAELAWGDYHYLQVFNILVRKCLHMMQLQLVGRNYFDPNAQVTIPDHRLCLWPGYYTSIRQHERDIMMNTELTFKVMRTDNVYDLLLEIRDENMFRKKVIGSVVLTFYNNKTYRVDDVSFQLNPKSTFKLKSGQDISYEQYFFEKYKIRIQVPTQPLLIAKAAKGEISAGQPREICLVPELCQLTGLSDDQRANFHLMSAVAQHTRVAPAGRLAKLQDFVNRLTKNQDVMKEVKRWDLNIANSLVQFTGRQLREEGIRLGEGPPVPAGAKADWTNSLRSAKMFMPGRMDKLFVITKADDVRRTEDFMKSLIQVARGMKWNLSSDYEMDVVDGDRSSDYLRTLDRVLPTKPSLVMVFVKNKSADRYNAIKKKCCVDRGIPSQVVLTKHFAGRGTMSVATKIAIQMNCKVGGAPWAVGIPLKGLMVVGYDVCRDTTNRGISFAGMVASLDPSCTRYFSGVAEQRLEQELSDHFSSFMVMACLKYQEINNAFPAKICIYRDGVGEGQVAYVLEHEVEKIKKRLQDQIYKDEPLKMAFVVVSKRINTRIFYKNQNPPPGTIVDNTITLPERYDFFIVSQCVNQGTVSPTNYNVIYDTMGLPPDHMQILAYKMCHMYYNWSGTVRVPAPCQYAHKLAFLTAQSLHRAAHRNLDTVLYFL